MRPSRTRNAMVAVTLAALAGCSGGGQDTTGAVGGSSAPSGVPTSASSAPTGSVPSGSPGGGDPTGAPGAQPPQRSAEPLPQAAPLDGAKVDAATLPETYDKQVRIGQDGRVLVVNGLAGGCKNASAEVAAQSVDQVLVTLVTTYYPPQGGGVCTDDLRPVPLTVNLDAPLGERRLVLESREEVG